MKKKVLLLTVVAVAVCSVTLISAALTSPTNPTAMPAAPMTIAFGPKTFTRTAGAPQTFTETFQHCGTAPCQIVVVNGNADRNKRVSSASISLNGKQIFRANDFNQQVGQIVKPVTLLDQNQLTITLASNPGSFLIVSVECLAPAAVLQARAPGVSLVNATTLLSAFQLDNTGTAPAENVQITSLTLPGGTLTTPTLPNNVGTIPAGGSAIVNANFTGGPFAAGATPVLTVQGTYQVGGFTFCFTLNLSLPIPPDAPGSDLVQTVTVGSNSVTGAPFPPQTPEFDDENQSLWTVPTGPFVPGTPTQTGTNAQAAPPLAKLNAQPLIFQNAPGPIEFLRNAGVGINTGSLTAEPSGASGGGVIFMTANWFAAYSTNGGTSFTELDPTTIFPNDAIGFCCDQIVQYVPSIDRFIWLLQGDNGYRLAAASPATIISSGGTSWTYWNLPPELFGQPVGTGVDYPDLSVGNNSLYMSWDVGIPCPTGCRSGLQVSRIAVTGIQAAGTITIDYTNPAKARMAWGSHLMQNTLDEIFWAGHNSNSQLRVFSLAEGSNTYFWRDRNISSWANNTLSSLTPDNQNWINKCEGAFPGKAIIGSTRVSNALWFAWTAGTDSNFQQPHVEMVTLDRNNNFSKLQQVQIWNNDYAFGYPALATNSCTGEVGLSLEYGGNGNYENHVVGFWGDFVVYITTGSNVGRCRFGDYVTIRQAPFSTENPGNLFTAFGYGLNSVSGTTEPDIRYVLFGRPASSCQIIK